MSLLLTFILPKYPNNVYPIFRKKKIPLNIDFFAVLKIFFYNIY